ncbi:nucleotide exchange factor GrpE [Treponema sp. R80B11-R83G3]
MLKKDAHSEKTEQKNTQIDEASADNSAGNQAETDVSRQSAEKGAESAGEAVKTLTPEEKIAELEAQLAETRDQLLRKAADFENFRKRMNQEKQNAIEYANQSLLLDIIPVIDDFERAIQAGEQSADLNAFMEGVKMIEKRLTSQLENKWGLKRFNSAGEPFDPDKHEALMAEKSPNVTEAVVQEDLIRGYLLKDRVIRAAKVKVLMPEASGASE